MKLTEAKSILKKNGYRLIGEGLKDMKYVCFNTYGDRSYNPETATVEVVNSKAKVIDFIMDMFDYGPDDITRFGAFRADADTAKMFEWVGDKDIADDPEFEPQLKKLLDEIDKCFTSDSGNGRILFNGDDFYDVWSELTGENEDEEDTEYDEDEVKKEYMAQVRKEVLGIVMNQL